MHAIEIKNLCKNFGEKQAVCGLNMTVPVGSIYGFIGENGSGKSTTEKMICGLLRPSGGSIRLFGREYTDADVRAKVGVLIETPGCFAGCTVWNNLKIQADNLGLRNADEEIRRVLKLVRMEGAAGNPYKNCSLGMKQRIGIAMALLGDPALLVLDEPINGLDADGMRIMREIFTDLTQNHGCTILVSSHILGELEKVATHYGIIREGKMLVEMTTEELNANCRTYVALQTKNLPDTRALLLRKFDRITEENGFIRVYDDVTPETLVEHLYHKGVVVTAVHTAKISLEEYYIDLMQRKEDKGL